MACGLGTGQDPRGHQEMLLQPWGQAPRETPRRSQPHRAFPPAGISPALQPTASPLCQGRGCPEDFRAQRALEQGRRVPQWVQLRGRGRELEEMFPTVLPHGQAPHAECPGAGCPTARHPTAGCYMGVS